MYDSVQANHILSPRDLLAVGTGLKDDIFEGRWPLRVPFGAAMVVHEHAEA